jgi:hypothetical protein
MLVSSLLLPALGVQAAGDWPSQAPAGRPAWNALPAPPRPAHDDLYLDSEQALRVVLPGGARADGRGRVLLVRDSRAGIETDHARVRVLTSSAALVSVSLRAGAVQAVALRSGVRATPDGGLALPAAAMAEALASAIREATHARANRAVEQAGLVELSCEGSPGQ